MTLTELNSTSIVNTGLTVYLDKEASKVRLSPIADEKERGMTQTIQSSEDLDKILKVYDQTDDYTISLITAFLNIDFEAYIKAQNTAKDENSDVEFRKVLAAMQKDLVKMSKKED